MMLRNTALVAAALVLASSVGAFAQEMEVEATEEQVAHVVDAIGMIGCGIGPSPVEKESDGLFEIDDAICANGQYDIKLNSDYVILSITFDGPHDDDDMEELATAEEVAAVEDAIALFDCRVGEVAVEKESDDLFEIDDAICEGGQYDIKLDGAFNVLNLTRD